MARLTALENERKQLRDELKDLKHREQLLLNDNNELEEENVTLQKQVCIIILSTTLY